MPMGPWHTDDRPAVPGVYCTRAKGEMFDYWRAWSGAWWSRGYWTRAGCLEAVRDHADLDQYPPREGGKVIRWREVLPDAA